MVRWELVWRQLEHSLGPFLFDTVRFNIGGERIELSILAIAIMTGILTLGITVLLNRYGWKGNSKTKDIFMTIFVAPPIEEIIFRLVLITVFSVIFNSLLYAILVSAFLFAIGHQIIYGGFRLIDSFISGILYGFLFLYVGLVAAIVAHMTHNLLAVATGG